LNQSIWVGIVIGVFFVGIGISYAIFSNTDNPSTMKLANQEIFNQMMSQNPKMMTNWMETMMQDEQFHHKVMIFFHGSGHLSDVFWIMYHPLVHLFWVFRHVIHRLIMELFILHHRFHPICHHLGILIHHLIKDFLVCKLQSARIVCVGKYSIANTYSYKKYSNNYSNPDALV